MTIADRIHNLRKMKNLSQEELADKLGVSRQSVSKWESEQSIPDADKVMMLSDYFEVTTDYLLKGIESEKEVNSGIDANIFTLVATVINFIALLVSGIIVYEEYNYMAVVIGLIMFAFSSMIFGFGQIVANKHVATAKRRFWIANIWMIVFIPLSALYNALFGLSIAPFPQRADNLLGFAAFFLVYAVICGCVSYMQFRKNKK